MPSFPSCWLDRLRLRERERVRFFFGVSELSGDGGGVATEVAGGVEPFSSPPLAGFGVSGFSIGREAPWIGHCLAMLCDCGGVPWGLPSLLKS